jgi:hypothetical protein
VVDREPKARTGEGAGAPAIGPTPQALGYTKECLWEAFAPTQAILARSVSLPIMVKETEAALDSRIEKLGAIAASIL